MFKIIDCIDCPNKIICSKCGKQLCYPNDDNSRMIRGHYVQNDQAVCIGCYSHKGTDRDKIMVIQQAKIL